jgi:hypothetical protein
MTTQRDWTFHSEFLQLQARHKREQASALLLEAEQLEPLASSAAYLADEPVRDALELCDG